jgi:hypothetical protein
MKTRWLGSTFASRELWGWWFLWFGPASVFLGAQTSVSPPTAAEPTPTQSVYLEYRELASSATPFNWGIPVAYQSTPFRKEPDLGGRKIVRGTFKFGDDTNHHVAFALDSTRAKLYLDLNRNLDLTDDPGGVYSFPISRVGNSVQTFSDIRLTFKTPMGLHPALLDLMFFNFGNSANSPTVSAVRRYCWEGKLAFEGREWYLGLIDSLQGRIGSSEGGYLVLQPWSDHNQHRSPQVSSVDVLSFSRRLFFGGQTFQVDNRYIQQDNRSKYRLDFTPQPAELGELKLAGKFINRLVLTKAGSEALTVVLDRPESVAKIPVGIYGQCRVSIKQGDTEAYRTSDRYGTIPLTNAVRVHSREAAVLEVGGPLTNSVSVNRRGKTLLLNYQLLGAGREAYELQGARTQPEFVVYRANKKIAAGKFEFG